MAYFAEKGFESYAISLRGTSGSPVEQRSVLITEHVDDLHAFVTARLPPGLPPPILVGHSFGGAYVLKYLEAGHPCSGAVLLCPVPPSGIVGMTLRLLRRSPSRAFVVTRGLAAKSAARSSGDARLLFFGDSLPEERLLEFMPRFEADCLVSLNVGHFARNAPSKQADGQGRARWLKEGFPALVIGAENDYIVDREGVEQAATFLGTSPLMLSGLPHDVMLCPEWKAAADEILSWAGPQQFAAAAKK